MFPGKRLADATSAKEYGLVGKIIEKPSRRLWAWL